jgi:hypothetical protein
MKKSVLLGIAAVALLALPAFAVEVKYEGWQGYWTWTSQPVGDFPVKMKIPWFVRIVNEENWVLELFQVTDCDFPCFRGCKTLEIACNFNLKLECQVLNKLMGADEWKCWYTNSAAGDAKVNMPGGTIDVCVQAKKVDLLDADLQSKAGETLQVATLRILCKPQ